MMPSPETSPGKGSSKSQYKTLSGPLNLADVRAAFKGSDDGALEVDGAGSSPREPRRGAARRGVTARWRADTEARIMGRIRSTSETPLSRQLAKEQLSAAAPGNWSPPAGAAKAKGRVRAADAGRPSRHRPQAGLVHVGHVRATAVGARQRAEADRC
jgi:hypothetical protein